MAGPSAQLTNRSEVRTPHRPLAGRNALRLTAVVLGVHGAMLLVSPGSGLSMFHAPPAHDAVYWLRSSGSVCVALAIVCWVAARWPASMMQRPVLLAAGIVTASQTIIGTLTVLDGTVATTFVAVVAIEAILAAWVWWVLLTDRV